MEKMRSQIPAPSGSWQHAVSQLGHTMAGSNFTCQICNNAVFYHRLVSLHFSLIMGPGSEISSARFSVQQGGSTICFYGPRVVISTGLELRRRDACLFLCLTALIVHDGCKTNCGNALGPKGQKGRSWHFVFSASKGGILLGFWWTGSCQPEMSNTSFNMNMENLKIAMFQWQYRFSLQKLSIHLSKLSLMYKLINDIRFQWTSGMIIQISCRTFPFWWFHWALALSSG